MVILTKDVRRVDSKDHSLYLIGVGNYAISSRCVTPDQLEAIAMDLRRTQAERLKDWNETKECRACA